MAKIIQIIELNRTLVALDNAGYIWEMGWDNDTPDIVWKKILPPDDCLETNAT